MHTLHTVPFSFRVKELTHGIDTVFPISIAYTSLECTPLDNVALASVRINASSNEVWMFSFPCITPLLIDFHQIRLTLRVLIFERSFVLLFKLR